jgi:hypothetical protein
MISMTELDVRTIEHNRRIETVSQQGWLRSFDNEPRRAGGIAALVSGTLRSLWVRKSTAELARPLSAQSA